LAANYTEIMHLYTAQLLPLTRTVVTECYFSSVKRVTNKTVISSVPLRAIELHF